MRKCLLLLAAFTMVITLTPASTGKAAIEQFSGKGEYIMEDNQAIKDAQEIAYNEAMRSIAQQAGVSIKGSSQSEDNTLTNDELEMMATTIAKVKDKNYKKEIGADGKIKVLAFVTAELDTEQADKMLKDMVEAKRASQGYEKIFAEYQAKQKQFDSLQGEYSAALAQTARQSVREGIKLERQGDIDGAMKFYQEAIEADGNLARAYSHRGHIYRRQGKYDLAAKDYDKAASLAAEEAGWHYGKATLYDQQGRTAQAVKEYRLFVKYADIMEYDEEITQALERIVTLDPDSVD